MKTRSAVVAVVIVVVLAVLGLVGGGQVSADVSSPDITPSPATAWAVAQYTVVFTPGAEVTPDGTVTVTLPASTVVPASIPANAVTVEAAGGSPTACTAAPLVIGTQIVVTVPGTVTLAAGDPATVVFSQAAGIENPPFERSDYVGYVHTSSETTDVASGAYSIDAAVSFSPASGILGSAATVTGVGFTPGTSVNVSGAVAGLGTVNSNGTFTIAGTAQGNGPVTATDGAGVSATSSVSNPLNLSAGIAVQEASAGAGSTVHVTVTRLNSGDVYVLAVGGTHASQAVSLTGVSTGTLVIGAVPAGSAGGVNYPAVTGVKASEGGMIVGTITIPASQAAGNTVVYVKESDRGAAAFSSRAAFSNAPAAGSGSVFVSAATIPAAVTPGQAFAGIADQLVYPVWTFDSATQSWQVYDITAGAPSTLTSMVPGQGYWVQVSRDGTLTYGSHTYTLKAGWNVVGWLG